MQKSFYITLPSNVHSHGHHSNVTSNYITYLPKAIELKSAQWEVALCEISYPHSWDNIYPPINRICFSYLHPEVEHQVDTIKDIHTGHYDNVQEVISAINRSKPEHFRGNFGFEKKGREMVKIILFPAETLRLHPILGSLLGFNVNKWEYPEDTPVEASENTEHLADRIRYKAHFHGDIKALLYNLYLYTNIVKENLVGDRYVPLLRTINVQGEDGDYVHKIFESPHYLPLASDFIENIEIRLTDDQGDNIRFQYGKVIVKLHFRKKNTWFHS